jgi:hypothetical protein
VRKAVPDKSHAPNPEGQPVIANRQMCVDVHRHRDVGPGLLRRRAPRNDDATSKQRRHFAERQQIQENNIITLEMLLYNLYD